MPQPVSYDAHAEMAKVAPPEAPRVAITATDEEHYLLRSNDHWNIVTELRNWHTLMIDDRIERTERFAESRGKQLDPDKKTAVDKRRRYLQYILMRESNHPDGDRRVAQIAFDALFPVKKRG